MTVGLAVAVALALAALDLNPAAAQTPVVAAWRVEADPGLDGTTAAWQGIPATVLPLTPQAVAPPMGGGTVATVAVRAAHWNDTLYVMVEWADARADALSDRPELFSDAAAVQFPSIAGTSVPTICMGQADQAVNIWHWRADTQAGFSDLPHGGYVDYYPSTEDLFYPGRQAGNIMSGTVGPVQNLVAGGFGSLTPGDRQVVTGGGTHGAGRWDVVFARPFTAPGALQPQFSADQPIDVAFAVWDGSLQQRNGIKSVSAFVQLRVTDEQAPGASTSAGRLLAIGLAGVVALVALAGIAMAVAGMRSRRDEA